MYHLNPLGRLGKLCDLYYLMTLVNVREHMLGGKSPFLFLEGPNTSFVIHFRYGKLTYSSYQFFVF